MYIPQTKRPSCERKTQEKQRLAFEFLFHGRSTQWMTRVQRVIPKAGTPRAPGTTWATWAWTWRACLGPSFLPDRLIIPTPTHPIRGPAPHPIITHDDAAPPAAATGRLPPILDRLQAMPRRGGRLPAGARGPRAAHDARDAQQPGRSRGSSTAAGGVHVHCARPCILQSRLHPGLGALLHRLLAAGR